MFKSILMPVDGSALSMGAAIQGITLAGSTGAVAHIYFGRLTPETVLLSDLGSVGGASVDRYDQQLRTDAEKAFKQLRIVAKEAGVELQTTTEPVSDPASAIIEYATKHHCDLIVIGSHGRSALKRMFLGGVAVRLLSHCKIPVLVYKETRGVISTGEKLLKR